MCVCVCVCVFSRTDSRLKGQRAKGQRQLVAQTTAGKSAEQQKREGGRQREIIFITLKFYLNFIELSKQ